MRSVPEVRLSPLQLAFATLKAEERMESAIAAGRKPKGGLNHEALTHGGRLWKDVVGMIGEMAAHIYFGIDFEPVVGSLDTKQGDVALPGVPLLQAKSTDRYTGRLILNDPGDNQPTHRFMLVTIAFHADRSATARLPGWMLGARAAQDKYWQKRWCEESQRWRTGWWIPQGDLRPIEELVCEQTQLSLAA